MPPEKSLGLCCLRKMAEWYRWKRVGQRHSPLLKKHTTFLMDPEIQLFLEPQHGDTEVSYEWELITHARRSPYRVEKVFTKRMLSVLSARDEIDCRTEPRGLAAPESKEGADGQELWALPEEALNTLNQEDRQVTPPGDTSRDMISERWHIAYQCRNAPTWTQIVSQREGWRKTEHLVH